MNTNNFGQKKIIMPRSIINHVLEIIARSSHVTIEQMMSSCRKREMVTARQRSMYFLKGYTKLSLAKIGGIVANKDHATVLHANKTVLNLMETDKTYKHEMEILEKMIIQTILDFEPTYKITTETPQISISPLDSHKSLISVLKVKASTVSSIRGYSQEYVDNLVKEIAILNGEIRILKNKLKYAEIPSSF